MISVLKKHGIIIVTKNIENLERPKKLIGRIAVLSLEIIINWFKHKSNFLLQSNSVKRRKWDKEELNNYDQTLC